MEALLLNEELREELPIHGLIGSIPDDVASDCVCIAGKCSAPWGDCRPTAHSTLGRYNDLASKRGKHCDRGRESEVDPSSHSQMEDDVGVGHAAINGKCLGSKASM